MWYMLFAATIADRLCETDTITREDLRIVFRRRMDNARGTFEAGILVPAYEECINRLDTCTPGNKLNAGYEPTGMDA